MVAPFTEMTDACWGVEASVCPFGRPVAVHGCPKGDLRRQAAGISPLVPYLLASDYRSMEWILSGVIVRMTRT
jgi:hypothetical protein